VGLSDFRLKSLKPVTGKRLEVADEHGLYVEVQPTGAKVWRFRYLMHGKREKVTIGPYPEIGLAEARKQRFEYAQMAAAGKSPAKAKQREKAATKATNTVKQLGDTYIEEVVRSSFSRPKDSERYFSRDIFPFLGHYRVNEVTPQDILRLLDSIKARGKRKAAESVRDGKHIAKAAGVHAAKQTRTLLKGLFDFAVGRQILTYNPASVIPRRIIAPTSVRQRALSPIEVKGFLERLNDCQDTEALKIALRIILLTLVRKGELVRAKWEDISFDRMEWKLPITKSKEPHLVPLSRQAAQLFQRLKTLSGESGWVLPGRSSAKPISEHTLNVMLDRHQKFGISDFVIHDLRRTASTILHERGFHPDVIEKALNHSIRGIRGVYNVARYADQRREMLQAWADYLDTPIPVGA
jgi:integrase